MWNKETNILSPNYVVVEKKHHHHHFYINGDDSEKVNDVANAVVILLNENKKNPILKKNIIMDEVVLLENGVKIGVAGQVKQIKVDDNSISRTNDDRVLFLQEFIRKF
jgi:hypothetical protein